MCSHSASKPSLWVLLYCISPLTFDFYAVLCAVIIQELLTTSNGQKMVCLRQIGSFYTRHSQCHFLFDCTLIMCPFDVDLSLFFFHFFCSILVFTHSNICLLIHWIHLVEREWKTSLFLLLALEKWRIIGLSLGIKYHKTEAHFSFSRNFHLLFLWMTQRTITKPSREKNKKKIQSKTICEIKYITLEC